ncbi:MAG: serine hydrolase, partial [Phycisphaerales bacterium]|nr:serine hydrolase [Phycisphaerales bacterium]
MPDAAIMGMREILERYQRQGLYTHAWWGYGRLDEAKPLAVEAVLPDGRTVFDLASLTKALVTTPLVFAGVESGVIGLDRTVGACLEAARIDRRRELDPRLLGLSVRSLLAHRSGLPAWRNFWVRCGGGQATETELRLPPAEAERALIAGLNRAAAALAPGPSPEQRYSDVGFLLMGLVLEWTNGRRLADSWADFSRDRLGIELKSLGLGYGVRWPGLAATAVPTAFCPLRRRDLIGEVHDENCAALGGECAHAGIFGTGEALGAYLHYLWKSPTGARLWAANAEARATPTSGESHQKPSPNEGLCGWRQGGDPSSEPFGDGMAMGHMGFTGVAFWVRPERKDYSAFLTNRVMSGRMRPGIAAARREIFAATQ